MDFGGNGCSNWNNRKVYRNRNYDSVEYLIGKNHWKFDHSSTYFAINAIIPTLLVNSIPKNRFTE